MFSGSEDISEGLRKYHLKLITPAVEKVGWEFKDGESYLVGQLRASLLLSAGIVGHQATVEEALKRFDAYIEKGDNK